MFYFISQKFHDWPTTRLVVAWSHNICFPSKINMKLCNLQLDKSLVCPLPTPLLPPSCLNTSLQVWTRKSVTGRHLLCYTALYSATLLNYAILCHTLIYLITLIYTLLHSAELCYTLLYIGPPQGLTYSPAMPNNSIQEELHTHGLALNWVH